MFRWITWLAAPMTPISRHVKMYLHLGQNVMVRGRDVIGIFDLDNTTWSFRTRRLLDRAEREGRVAAVGDDLPRSFVVVQERKGPPAVYITPLSSAALSARAARELSAGINQGGECENERH